MSRYADLRCEVCGSAEWMACAPGDEPETLLGMTITRGCEPSALCLQHFLERFGEKGKAA